MCDERILPVVIGRIHNPAHFLRNRIIVLIIHVQIRQHGRHIPDTVGVIRKKLRPPGLSFLLQLFTDHSLCLLLGNERLFLSALRIQ